MCAQFINLPVERSSAMLKEGDKAPAFKALDAEGNQVKLSDFRGQKVALTFIPKTTRPAAPKRPAPFAIPMQS
jgi:peroxiredoxin